MGRRRTRSARPGKEVPETSEPVDTTGCDSLPFGPVAEVIPDQHSASTPTGLTVKVKSPQTTTLEPIYDQGTAEADVGETNLVLPLGMMASPSAAANGLETCSVGAAGFTHGGEGDKGAVLESDLNVQSFTPVAASSPRIGEGRHRRYPLSRPQGRPHRRPLPRGPGIRTRLRCRSAFYIVAKEKTSEVLVKLAGEVHINPETGQLSSDFKDTPQAPFEELTLRPIGRRACIAVDAGHVRHVRLEGYVHELLQRRPSGQRTFIRHHLRPARLTLPQRDATARNRLPRGKHQHAGRRVQPVQADDRTP